MQNIILMQYLLSPPDRFDQSEMSQHFLTCLERGEMSPFPSELKRCKRPVKTKKVQLYCACRLPEDGEEPIMAFCESCRQLQFANCSSLIIKVNILSISSVQWSGQQKCGGLFTAGGSTGWSRGTICSATEPLVLTTGGGRLVA